MPRGRRRVFSCVRFGVGTTLAVLVALPFVPAAHAATTELVPAGTGLTMPSGIAVTTEGSVWVADRALGVCRVDPAATPRLVESNYCKPEPAETEEGPAPTPRLGPSTAHQMAFDPVSRNFFVTEGSSRGGGIWRMHWNESGNSIDSAQKLVSTGEDRVFALSIGTNANGVYVDFAGRDDQIIRRIENAAMAPVGAPTSPVGAATSSGVTSMANLDGTLYLAEGNGVTRIATPGSGAVAELIPGFPVAAGSVPNALAADPARGRVYAGTANVNNLDTVDVLTPGDGQISTYESGFALVTGLGVRPDGALLIADDAPAAAGAPESLGQSRLVEASLRGAHVPTVTITGGAEVYSNTTSVTFRYSASTSATFSCRFDGGEWMPCGTGATGSRLYTEIADGTHVFEVRGSEEGQPAKQVFTVDTLAPTASVDNPQSDQVIASDALRVRFSADEFGVTFACELDGQPLAACEPPLWLRDLSVGEHTFTVTPTDLAANAGATVAWTFTRTPPPPPPAPPAGDDNSGSGSSSSGPGSAPETPTPAPAPVTEQASGASVAAPGCRAIAAPGRGASYRLNSARGRILTARITPPAGARYAKLTLRPSGTAKGLAQKLALKSVSGTKARDLRVVLTSRQAARLRSRRAVLAIAYGTCPSRLGGAGRLTLRTSTPSSR